MFTDMLFIVTTGFALFGLYCFIVTICEMLAVQKFPPSVMVICDTDDETTYQKIKYVEQNIPNNHIVLYQYKKNGGNADNDSELQQIIKDVLSVNNK